MTAPRSGLPLAEQPVRIVLSLAQGLEADPDRPGELPQQRFWDELAASYAGLQVQCPFEQMVSRREVKEIEEYTRSRDPYRPRGRS